MGEVKLRTLKDLTHYFNVKGGFPRIDEAELKQEAIKWVKKINSKPFKVVGTETQIWMNSEWIKHFFNITEEDLK